MRLLFLHFLHFHVYTCSPRIELRLLTADRVNLAHSSMVLIPSNSFLYTILAVLFTPFFLLALAAYIVATVDSWSRVPKVIDPLTQMGYNSLI
jgi:hypothetical protein